MGWDGMGWDGMGKGRGMGKKLSGVRPGEGDRKPEAALSGSADGSPASRGVTRRAAVELMGEKCVCLCLRTVCVRVFVCDEGVIAARERCTNRKSQNRQRIGGRHRQQRGQHPRRWRRKRWSGEHPFPF